MSGLAKYVDRIVLLGIIVVFSLVGARRIGVVPLPDNGDESFTLQVPYEMLNRGKLALPMYRLQGGNIENVWHSFTPVFFVILTAFLKLFGFGLTQGRVFNLICADGVIVLVYLIATELFEWRVALSAVVLMVLDPVFLERSRMIRNDFAAAAFVLAAFYAYIRAERSGTRWIYIASGMLAGAGVMCHTNALYIMVVILVLFLVKGSPRVLVRNREAYVFFISALAVMAYEIVYDLIDFRNFQAQNRGDPAHFTLLSPAGLLRNVYTEPQRYISWYHGADVFPFGGLPQLPLHIFQVLTAASIVYLLVVTVRHLRLSTPAGGRLSILIVTLGSMLFLAVMSSHRRKKSHLYLVHLTPWFALSAGVLLSDLHTYVSKSRFLSRWLTGTRLAAIGVAAAGVLAFGALVREGKEAIRAIDNPELANFQELAGALRAVIPPAICPVSITRPVIWLAFPEKDYCYSTIEGRAAKSLELTGNEYALVDVEKNRLGALIEQNNHYNLLGEVRGTAYGDFEIYYTGSNPALLEAQPHFWWLFGYWRGHVNEQQLAAAKTVWTVDSQRLAILAAPPPDAPISFGSESNVRTKSAPLLTLGEAPVAPNMIYQIQIDWSGPPKHAEVMIEDSGSGQILYNCKTDEQRCVFRTFQNTRLRVLIEPGSATGLSSIQIKEVAATSS
jgi:4-amino-4-deoxy-L-arabinose transferase-like glycosyltransferase